jgi:hypothetical protein
MRVVAEQVIEKAVWRVRRGSLFTKCGRVVDEWRSRD